jgi:hypothetical protein
MWAKFSKVQSLRTCRCSRGDHSARDVDQEELRKQRDAFTSTPAGGGRADQFEQFAPVAALIDFAHDAP